MGKMGKFHTRFCSGENQGSSSATHVKDRHVVKVESVYREGLIASRFRVGCIDDKRSCLAIWEELPRLLGLALPSGDAGSTSQASGRDTSYPPRGEGHGRRRFGAPEAAARALS